MQFNSYVFIMVFMPTVIILYFLANKIHFDMGKYVLLLGSFAFYGYMSVSALLILLLSAVINYLFVRLIYQVDEYSCAVKPHIRAGGNRQSGIRETVIASLLA